MIRGRSCILTYHSLDTSGSVISVSPAVFAEQMDWLAASGIPVAPLDRIGQTPGAVAITFDDGFRNFYEQAAPVLGKHGFPATVFLVAEFCGGWNDWPSQPRQNGIPRLPLMSWDEVGQVAKAGIAIGCHTATHPFLSRLSAIELEQELDRGRSAIEERIGTRVDTLAYPYGDAAPAVRAAAGRHFRLACSTRLGFVTAGFDALDLPRLDVYYLRRRLWFRGLYKGYGTAYLTGRSWLRAVRQRLIF